MTAATIPDKKYVQHTTAEVSKSIAAIVIAVSNTPTLYFGAVRDRN